MNGYTIILSGDGGHQNMAGNVQSYSAGTRAIIWYENETWWSCLDGVGDGGNLWESDNYGPFESAQDAEQFAREMFETD